MHAYMVKHHKRSGAVSKNPKNNAFITVGSVENIHKPALNKIYPGGLCEASLCSFKPGNQRFMLCDCKGVKSHELPEKTGPADKANWAKIKQMSLQAMEEK